MNRYLSDLIYAAAQRFKRFHAWSDRTIDQMFGGVDPDSQLAHAFKTDAEALEEAPVPLSAHIALYAVLTFLGLAIIWSIVGTLDRIVVAQGKIATRTPLIVMSPYTTSRIQQIRVLPGDHVKKGQILVSFDPAFAQADVAALEHKVKSSSAEVERLEAQLGGLPFTTAPDDPPERKTQGQIYTQEQASYAAEIAQRNSRISALNAQIKADVSAVDGLNNQLGMANKVVGIYQGLVAQKAGAPLDVMKAQSNAIDVQMRLQNTQGDLKKLTDQRAETAAERASFLDKWRSDHNQQLVKARQDLADARETLNKARQMKEYADLRAPANAVVLEIADRSVGSVMKEAETLVTLVPDGADLYAEANVPARDVSHLKVGNTVRVKLEAYPFQKYGTIDGRLDVLSADSVPLKEDEKTQLVYHARVRLLTPLAELAKRGLRVRPGMVLSAEIKTGKRTIASYVMNPILRTADEGMREP
ncbi:HlyD family type I secretion periplasmic adaptor subunit [Rhizomicrobium electricum]|jgi:HlyD family secretion protein|uniref:Membrane fusion protein (MFP) family protein n=1 Tax=Rhizomicrobium electricum TaxID=480070 RepID=A0ABN1EB05_9PROT|nr:HlyD family type I secretion periplasmic adaptor subunit [Rhizomicrobium electricum]NIJ48107.1 HlyD family secretion protein [Rhizomicrobium electricum]